MKIPLCFTLTILLYNTLLSQICYDPENVYEFEYNGIKYEIVRENKTWTDAANCAYSMGGKLAEINSQEEQDTIFFHLGKADIDPENTVASDGGDASYIWIGGTDNSEESKWIWDGANTGFGEQFWEGLRNGNSVNGLYNNWGNEPDNFNEQDGLGLAITNWPYGTAGQWNDISLGNHLYFIVEYDSTTIKLNDVEYDYNTRSLVLYPDFKKTYDSVYVSLNDSVIAYYAGVTARDSILSVYYTVDTPQSIAIRISVVSGVANFISQTIDLYVYSKNNPLETYYSDFEDNPEEDFLVQGFKIKKEFGFRNYAVHSNHNYEINCEYLCTLIRPIIVDHNNPIMTYSDVAIVEPGTGGSEFGDSTFNDYVIVEGSSNLIDWIPLLEGYDANYDPEWESAWANLGLLRNMFKTHSINFTDNFSEGDTVLIRFRLYSNSSETGWGWVIDSLNIQALQSDYHTIPLITDSYQLHQNYPNPFNPVTSISFEIPNKEFVKLSVFDMLGREIETILAAELAAGSYTYDFDASNYSSGTYIYRIVAGEYSQGKKLILLK